MGTFIKVRILALKVHQKSKAKFPSQALIIFDLKAVEPISMNIPNRINRNVPKPIPISSKFLPKIEFYQTCPQIRQKMRKKESKIKKG